MVCKRNWNEIKLSGADIKQRKPSGFDEYALMENAIFLSSSTANRMQYCALYSLHSLI